jgi:hypothetical protein
MAQTTFSGPVTSNAGFNSDDTLTSADYTNGGFNLTNFTVRPAATYANTVAALVGAVNQRTAGVRVVIYLEYMHKHHLVTIQQAH